MDDGELHRNDLYRFMLSQPSGLDTASSGAKPFVLEPLLLGSVPRFARFLAEPAADSALRLTPEVGEADLLLVAADILGKESCFSRPKTTEKWMIFTFVA